MFGMIPYNNNERNLFDYLDKMEKNFWDGSFSDAMQFRCDVQDKGENYLLEAELPGFDKNDIGINLNGDSLVISACHNLETEDKSDDGSYLRRERKYGTFSRSFDVSGIDTDHIKAEYKNGILALTLPKKNSEIPTTRRIEIAGE